jgi:18S rRNA (adenine1779-N6/adenine1780-N6)-dimethyltransferase
LKPGLNLKMAKASNKIKTPSSGDGKVYNPLFNKELGQHILKSPLVAQHIVEKANVQPTDVVLEIGPGTGNLTVRILEVAKKVIAIERDPRLAAELVKRLQGTPLFAKLQLIVGDFMEVDLPFFDVCISNTPYQISSPLTFKLLRHRPLFRCAVLMFQREFAMRLVARPGEDFYCRLSVNAQLMSHIAHVMKVSKNSFRPPPQVESSVVRITPYSPPPSLDIYDWDGLLRVLFMRKNKTISANFKSGDLFSVLFRNYTARCEKAKTPISLTQDQIKQKCLEVLEQSGYAQQRSSKLKKEEMLELFKAFDNANVHFEGAFGGSRGGENVDLGKE